jgi:hypothetical protein
MIEDMTVRNLAPNTCCATSSRFTTSPGIFASRQSSEPEDIREHQLYLRTRYLPTLVSPIINAELEQFAVDAGRTKVDSRGQSSESVGGLLLTLVDARGGHDELSRSRTAESPYGTSQ